VSGQTTTTPFGNLEEPFDLCRLAIGAGAPFVARWTVGYPYETIAAIGDALSKQGFGFVELLMPCPTGFGKKNEQVDTQASWEWYKKNTITRIELAQLDSAAQAANSKIVVGTLWDIEKPEFSSRWAKLIARLAPES
jgi:2-oxoglutarate ferredoxin oxidoreductase subunit beta